MAIDRPPRLRRWRLSRELEMEQRDAGTLNWAHVWGPVARWPRPRNRGKAELRNVELGVFRAICIADEPANPGNLGSDAMVIGQERLRRMPGDSCNHPGVNREN